jgi:uncharacterized protein YbjQ (UPF0145 family)
VKSKPKKQEKLPSWHGVIRREVILGTPLAKHIRDSHQMMTKEELRAYEKKILEG